MHKKLDYCIQWRRILQYNLRPLYSCQRPNFGSAFSKSNIDELKVALFTKNFALFEYNEDRE